MPDKVGPFRPAGRFRSKWYGLLWRISQLLHRAGNACGYVAAGSLRREDLCKSIQLQFRGFKAQQDDVEAGLTAFEARVCSKWLRPSDRALLVGCGAGRTLIGLIRSGYDVAGLDQAPDLVETARKHLARLGITTSVSLGFVEKADLQSQYDAIMFADTCYSHLHPAAVRVATLRRLRSHLLPTGRILISYIGSDTQTRWPVALMRCGAWLASADWRPEYGDIFTRNKLMPSVLDFGHYFLPGDVAQECVNAGFRVISEESSSGQLHCLIAQLDDEARVT